VRGAWFIARKDVAYLLRHRETLFWVFLMPLLFIYFVGSVTGGFGRPPADRRDPLAVRGATDGGVLADELVHRLEDQRYAIVRPETDEAFAAVSRRLTIPASPGTTFTDAALRADVQILTLQSRGDPLAAGYDQLRVARAMYEVLADLAVLKTQGVAPSSEAFARLKAMPRTLTLTVTSAGRRAEPPSGYSQAVPGQMVMFTMLALLTVGAIMLVIEREQGLLRRLASAPVSPGSVVLGKWIGRMMLGLVQIAFAMFIGTVLFKMDWGRAWPMVGLVLFGWAAFVASLAIVLANLARSVAQMTGLGVLTTMVLAALGGCMWPIEIAPRPMQVLALFLPTGWTMDAIHRLVNFGDTAPAAIPHVLALFAGALVLGWIGARTFRYQ
jgi:ABC-2 type transport system permease protein